MKELLKQYVPMADMIVSLRMGPISLTGLLKSGRVPTRGKLQ